MNVSAQYRDIAREFAAELRRRCGQRVRTVLLYGSVARGDATEGSDIDLLVVYDDDSEGRRDTQLGLAAEFMDRYSALIAVVDCTPGEYEKLRRFPFGWQVQKEAVSL